MLSASKLYQSLSTCGPSATLKPRSAKIAAISSITWLTGWIVPSASGRGGRVTSAHSRATRASSAASASRARASASASVRSSFSAFSAGPAVCRCLGAHRPEPAHQLRHLALLAERREAHLLERRLVGGGGDRGHVFLAEAGDLVHASRPQDRATPTTSRRDCKTPAGRRLMLDPVESIGGGMDRRRRGAARPEPAKARHCLVPVRRLERASAEAEGVRASPSARNPRAPAWQVRLRACQAGRWSAPLSLDRVRRRF